jgi:transposase
MQEALFGGSDAALNQSSGVEQLRVGVVRMRLADRSQMAMQMCSIDELVAIDHPVRLIWDAVCQMDLSGFTTWIEVGEFTAGRSANDVRVMVGLWLWAATNNVARGRQLERLCQTDLTYKWMCGGLSMNYHTLNDFRVGHQTALDQLFTATLGRLLHAGLVSVTRISQDGLRVCASAGTGSFHTRPTLEKCLAEAQTHLADLKKRAQLPDNQGMDEQENQRKTAVATDRLDRVKAALSQITQVEGSRVNQSNKQKRERPARASTTDPEARLMKMPNGGFNPAYNVQLASDPVSRAIVGVMVSNSGGDAPLSEPMRQQVELRSGEKVSEHLIDGGYVNLQAIDHAAGDQVDLYMPVPQANKRTIDRFARREKDSDAVAAWRQRMSTQPAKAIYQQRASTSETINADLRTHRGMSALAVRGIMKVTCIALWSAMAYNLMHFVTAIT